MADRQHPQRVAPPAAVGSLFKRPAPITPRQPSWRQVPERDPAHLEYIRQCPCLGCGMDPAGEAAHVRMASAVYGKPNPGIGRKPADKWSLPLCRDCHKVQHEHGEAAFWEAIKLNPIIACMALARLSPNVEAMRAYALVAAII